MDLEMPEVNGLDAMIAIRNEFPDARIIILTTMRAMFGFHEPLKAGARGYLLKSLLRKELFDTIRAVMPARRGFRRILPRKLLITLRMTP